MQLTTATKVVTTKTHTATFSGDDVKASLLSIAKKGIDGLTDDKVASSDVAVAADGTFTISIVERPAEADAPTTAETAQTTTAAPAAPAPAAAVAPTGLHFPAAHG